MRRDEAPSRERRCWSWALAQASLRSCSRSWVRHCAQAGPKCTVLTMAGAHVTITDRHDVLDLLELNVQLNCKDGEHATVKEHSW